MRIEITNIKGVNNESVEITAIVYWRGLPKPYTFKGEQETDEQYAIRAEPVAKELTSFNNLHIGRAELYQGVRITTVPKVDEYDT